MEHLNIGAFTFPFHKAPKTKAEKKIYALYNKSTFTLEITGLMCVCLYLSNMMQAKKHLHCTVCHFAILHFKIQKSRALSIYNKIWNITSKSIIYALRCCGSGLKIWCLWQQFTPSGNISDSFVYNFEAFTLSDEYRTLFHYWPLFQPLKPLNHVTKQHTWTFTMHWWTDWTDS